MRTLAVATLMSLALLGCVLYPTQRTYFEPNAMDGVPTPSRSCGYHKARNDALARDTDGLHVQVSPAIHDEEPMSVTVLFRAPSPAEVSPDRFQLWSLPNETRFPPVSYEVTRYEPDVSHPYYSTWVTLRFQVMPEQLTEIAVVFPIGSVSLNGATVDLAQFRFSKTTKSDIYYSSINC